MVLEQYILIGHCAMFRVLTKVMFTKQPTKTFRVGGAKRLSMGR